MNKILIIGMLCTLLGLIGCNNNTNGQTRNLKPTFQEQIVVFTELGFILNEGIDTSDINRWENGYKEFEDQPYNLMYITFGQTIEKEPWTPITNKCWNFDLEAINGQGDYCKIMKNISRITNGELIFENLQDSIDIENSKAWVSFTCKGDYYKWDLKVDTDWADGSLFDKVQSLTNTYKTKGKFTFYNTGGQGFVLGYYTTEEFEKIKKVTGLDILWLQAKGQIY